MRRKSSKGNLEHERYILFSRAKEPLMMKTPTKTRQDMTVLFQGDSITDAGRNYLDDEVLGVGYVMMTAAWFSALHPERRARFINRGVSGNKIRDMKERWKKDCLELKPDVVSILIGVNDVLGRYFSNDPTSVESFEADYRRTLELTRSVFNARIVLMEPFIIQVGKEQVRLREDLDPKIEVVNRLSDEFKTLLVPLDRVFCEAAEKREPAFWSADGVHPTLAGHALIAQSWLRVMTDVLLQG
jgi:acyl-CoA thioesterase-1